MSTSIALFDVDGTLVPSNTWAVLLSHPRLGKTARRRVMRRVLPVWLGVRLRLASDDAFRQQWVQAVAALLRGWSRSETNELFDWVVANMADAFYPSVVARLRRHVDAGDHVVLVSGMYVELVGAFARHVGAAAGVGSQLVYDGDVCSGTISGPGCNGPHKLTYVRQYLAAHGIEPDLSTSSAYADSYSDVPMLSSVQHAVAAAPDARLRAYAVSHGWEVLDPPSD